MSLYYTCRLVSPGALKPTSSWDLRPFLPETLPVGQSLESIQRVGLLHQPIVQSLADGSHEFITGKRCYNALQAIDPGCEVWCRVISEDIAVKELLVVLFEENSCIQPLSPIELAYFFQLCQNLLVQKDQQELYGLLGLQAKPHFINRTLQLLSLEISMQTALMRGKISDGIARELLRMDDSDRTAVYSLFLQLNIGGGKQRRLLSMLKDLGGRQGTPITEYLGNPEIQDILTHPEMNIPQKTHSLLQLLQSQQSPSLQKAEESFTAWQTALLLPENYDIQHSQAFEQDAVTLSVTFKNKEQLEKCLPDIKLVIEQGQQLKP